MPKRGIYHNAQNIGLFFTVIIAQKKSFVQIFSKMELSLL